MQQQLGGIRTHHSQRAHWQLQTPNRHLSRAAGGVLGLITLQRQCSLPPGHRQVDVCQNFRVEQSTVQLALRIVDVIAIAQRVEIVLLAGVSLPRHDQRVDHLAQLLDAYIAAVEQLQLVVEEADIEWGVVDDQFGAANEVQQLLDHMAEQRLIGDHFIGDAVHLHRRAVEFALGIDVLMKMPACQPAIDQFDTADFDQTVALAGFQTSCFGVERDLPHSYSSNVYAWARNSSMPRFASASASSFSR